MPPIKLDEGAVQLLLQYRWSGNIRQLRNVAEQISVLETNRTISIATLRSYLPDATSSNLPAVIGDKKPESDFSNEREILYKVLFDMKSDLNDLKKLTLDLMQNDNTNKVQESNKNLIQRIYGGQEEASRDFDEMAGSAGIVPAQRSTPEPVINHHHHEEEDEDEGNYLFAETVEEEETLRLDEKEVELIKKALERNNGKRKAAADELGISERTLYRKIKQYNL